MKKIFCIIEDLLIQKIPSLGKIFSIPKYEFGWIIHARNETDFARNFKSDGSFIIKISRFLWPFRVGEIKIVSGDGVSKDKKGCIIAIPLTAKQMSTNEKLSEKRIFQSIKLAKVLGIKNLGVAGIAGVIVEKKKNKFKTQNNKNINLINGFSLLLTIAFDKISSLINQHNNEFEKVTLGIVGATSILGKPFTNLLAESNLNIQKIILIGKTKENLIFLKEEIIKLTNRPIEITTDLSETKKCNFLVVTINSIGVVIKQENIAPNTIILDITQPPNKYIHEIKKTKGREDLIIIDNILINTPDVEYNLDIGIPLSQSYVCVGEVLLSLKDGKKYKEVFSQEENINKIDLKTIDKVRSFLLKHYNYTK